MIVITATPSAPTSIVVLPLLAIFLVMGHTISVLLITICTPKSNQQIGYWVEMRIKELPWADNLLRFKEEVSCKKVKEFVGKPKLGGFNLLLRSLSI